VPELPEVFTITQNLKEILPKAKLLQAEIFEEYRSIPKISAFEELYNQEVSEVSRISKYILIKFEIKTLVVHLGMTGRIRYSKTPELFRWDKIRFKFEKNSEVFYLNFTDTRKFGKVKIVEKVNLNSGIEPFDLTSEKIQTLTQKIKKKNTEIKNILLDQTVISGLGNIYSNDTLFISKINPLTKGKDLSNSEIEKIIFASNKALSEGIEKKGSSMKDKMYTDIFGNYGEYQDNFKIYERKNCLECQTPIIKIHIKGRSSFYCPNCQPVKL
jgi:formamidopyrimidine-DNA glycosylase